MPLWRLNYYHMPEVFQPQDKLRLRLKALPMPFRRTCRALPNGAPARLAVKNRAKRNQMTGSFFISLSQENARCCELSKAEPSPAAYIIPHGTFLLCLLSHFRLSGIFYRMMRPNNSPFFSRSRFSAHILLELFPGAAEYEKNCHRPRISSIVFIPFFSSR